MGSRFHPVFIRAHVQLILNQQVTRTTPGRYAN